jgi:hypothetical protein
MDYSETRATLGRRHRKKTKKTKITTEKTKKMKQHGPHQKTRVKPVALEG